MMLRMSCHTLLASLAVEFSRSLVASFLWVNVWIVMTEVDVGRSA